VFITRPPAAPNQPTAQREIHPGQAVRLGHTRLHFVRRADTEDEVEVEEAEEPSSSAAPATTEGTFKRLRVIDGADLGRAFRLPKSGTIAVGKSPRDADIILHDLYVSRVHCVVEVEEGAVLVRHSEGDNGTLINGQRITEQRELHIGDVLRVGNSHLRLETALTLDSAPAMKEEEGELTTKDEESAEHAEPPHELIGQVLGQFRIIELLGRGHTAEVFRASNLKTNVVVALKVLPPEFPADGQELQTFVGALKVVTQLHHANLVTIHTAGRSGVRCWIAREYVEGESAAVLARRLGRRKKIEWTLAGRVAVHLARALAFLHRQRTVHGNVTPANVLLGEDGTTRLADLMLARALGGSRLLESVLEQKLLAELPYLAPEQTYPDSFVDHLADLYGLGAVVYTLLTGQPPFRGDSPAEIIEQVRKTTLVRPSTYQRGIPSAFEEVVLKLMAKHQENRYQTAAELLSEVESIAEEYEIEV
jgi:serine/threonine-protein kinase